MEQQLPRSSRLVVEMGRRRIFRYVGIHEKKLASALIGIGLGYAGLPLAQHLDLGALQHKPGLDCILDEIVMARAAVLRDVAVRRSHQLSRPAPRIACCTLCCVSGTIAQSGWRTSGVQRPSSEAAYLTGAGLVSANSASCSGISRSLMSRTVLISPRCQASCISEQSRGATLAVTDMQPSPPWARYATAVASSPDSRQNPAPISPRI